MFSYSYVNNLYSLHLTRMLCFDIAIRIGPHQFDRRFCYIATFKLAMRIDILNDIKASCHVLGHSHNDYVGVINVSS